VAPQGVKDGRPERAAGDEDRVRAPVPPRDVHRPRDEHVGDDADVRLVAALSAEA